MKRLIALLLALTMALALVACGGNNTAGNNAGNTSGENDTQPPVTDGSSDSADNAAGTDETGDPEEGPSIDDVTLNHTTYTLSAFGESFQLLPEGVEGTYAATYTSSDEDVAVVDTEGNVTAAGVGSATITQIGRASCRERV